MQQSELRTILCPWSVDESTSFSPASSTSSSQDTLISTENPATERSETMSEESRGNPWRGSAEAENTNKNEDDEELRSELLQDVSEWLQDFKERLVKNVQPHQYSPSSAQWSRGPKWNRVRVSILPVLTSRKTEIVTSA